MEPCPSTLMLMDSYKVLHQTKKNGAKIIMASFFRLSQPADVNANVFVFYCHVKEPVIIFRDRRDSWKLSAIVNFSQR